MKKTITLLFAMLVPVAAMASGGGQHLPRVDVNLENKDSIRRGAKTFVNYCLSCHSANYMRFQSLVKDMGIDEKKAVDNLIFMADFSKKSEGQPRKVGDTMGIAMRTDDAKQWFGTAVPDLSVIARSRSAEWLYGYFTTFYIDEKRPYGVNNAVFPNVGMPHVFWELEGMKKANFHVDETTNTVEYAIITGGKTVSKQTVTEVTRFDEKGKPVHKDARVDASPVDEKGNAGKSTLISHVVTTYVDGNEKENKVMVKAPDNIKENRKESGRSQSDKKHIAGYEMVVPGKMDAVEYKKAMTDLVTFLVYMGEPGKLERQRMGVLVIFFLVILLVFAYLLKREYWKDVH